ncbi:S-layer homology domain-containing protein [Ureibacillus chungkukjangi]|uniref:S-layer homology domain-containing protein n=1 Tax=Ureibacillus chungkukjangi TaxID=1202712 RepID=UPI00384F1A5A
MGNQYKKFVATAATATLVASAIVPVVSASANETKFEDVKGTTYEVAVNSIAGLNIVSGYDDGTFKPTNIVNRSGVVKFLGKYLVAQGEKLPTYEDVIAKGFPFKDLNATSDKELVQYAALVKEAGVFTGYEDGTLRPSIAITRHQTAKVLVQALKEIYGVDLMEKAKAANFKSEIIDIKGNVYKDQIEALDFAGITTVKDFRPAQSLNRGQFAIFLNNSLNYFANQVGEVEKISNVKALTLVEGTDVLSKLPTTIEATLKAAEGKVAPEVNLNASWKAPESFDNTKEGNYEFVGTLTAPNKKVVIPVGGETVKVSVTIVSQEDFDAAVKAVKTQADLNATDLTAFKAALLVPVLNLQNIEDSLVEEYQTAMADAFASQVDSVEEIQAIINHVNEQQRLALEAAKAKQLAAVKAANGVNEMRIAFNLDKVEANKDYPVTFVHVSTTSADLEAYKNAIAAKNPADLVAVQKVIEEVNNTKAEKAVALAEKSLKTEDISAARNIISTIESVYVANGDVFDTKAAGKTVGSFELRLQAAELTGAINAFVQTVKVDQVDQSFNFNISYPVVSAEQQALVSEYTAYSEITVPAAFAGAVLKFELIEGTFDYTVPTAKEGDTTITFSLLDVINANAPTLASQSGDSFNVKVTVPFESTTLVAGNYNVKFNTVVSAGTGENADVRTIASESVSVNIVADPAIPNAIQEVLTATDNITLTTALNDLKALDSTLEFNGANVEKYLTAFNAYSTEQNKAATVTSLLVTIKKVDEAVTLESAIQALVDSVTTTDVVSNLKVETLGFTLDEKTNKLNVVTKNAGLYLEAIKADVEAAKDEKAYTTAADVQAMVNEVNASELGNLNTQTSVAEIEKALLALNNNDINLVYNGFNNNQKITALEVIKAHAGFASEEAVYNELLKLVVNQ